MPDDRPTVAFVVATYEDVSAAEADRHAVDDLYRTLGRIEPVDAVVLGKTLTGLARIYEGGGRRVTAGRMAIGLAVALFPSVQIGSVGWTAVDGAVTGALAGRIASGMSRNELKELGDHVDSRDAAMIVATSPDMENRVVVALGRVDDAIVRHARPDIADIERETAAIRSAGEAP
jgi:uncharacterized membrane protein